MHAFTTKELKIIQNSKFFYTKASATKKIDSLLAEARDEIKSIIEREEIIFPKEVDIRTGKIFRGENYRGLPYLVLDYPKYFGNDSVSALLTMFCWGTFFSCTLQLQGKALEERRNLLIQNEKLLRKKDIYICVNKTPWQYYYTKENYVLADTLSEDALNHRFMTKDFVKLSRKIPLKDYTKLKKFAGESFRMFSSVIPVQ